MQNQSMLYKAIEFAKAATAGDKRLSGDEYIQHALRVKNLLEEIGISDENILISAILHGVLKYNLTNPEEIKKEFNEEISYLVQKSHEISRISLPNKSVNFNNDFLNYLIHLAEDIRVLLIRLADRLDNIRSSEWLGDDKRKLVAEKALSIYAPIAYSVGIYKFTREMQNEAMSILHPKDYKLISEIVTNRYQQIENKLNSIKKDIAEFILDSKVESYSISSRTKSPYSIYQKVHRKYRRGINKENVLELKDLAGIRILLPDINSCYALFAHIQSKWEMIPEEYDDYIANPKSNGYQTLQAAFKIPPDLICEIQIRTFEMHNRNEFGGASHLQYKFGDHGAHTLWLKKLIGTSDGVLSEQAIKGYKEFFETSVFVFTPKYDLITLPKNSTPIDFAYKIHSDLGDKCSGVKINGNIAKFDTKLKSGDIVEIITSKNGKPNDKWMEFVRTPEARKHIKRAITQL